MQRQKAFSLIELLVVLGILAVLFAIVYPSIVRSIESAHKTHALSNMKQLTSGFLQFATDHEGRLPYAFAWDEDDESWRFQSNIPKPVTIPSGWTNDESFSGEAIQKGDEFHWSHAVHRYVKSYEVYEAPGLPQTSLGIKKGDSGNEPAKCSFTYNGLLHGYPLNSVCNPSKTPILWTGFGRTTVIGFASSNPYLCCGGDEECQYKSIGGPKGALCGIKDYSVQSQSVWIYGKGTPVAYTDGSVRVQKFGMSAKNSGQEPFATYNTEGVPKSYYSNNLVPDMFKPDQE